MMAGSPAASVKIAATASSSTRRKSDAAKRLSSRSAFSSARFQGSGHGSRSCGTRRRVLPGVADDMERHAGYGIAASDQQQRNFGIIPNNGEKYQQNQNQDAGLLFSPGQILETIKTDGAGHQSGEGHGKNQPRNGPAPVA